MRPIRRGLRAVSACIALALAAGGCSTIGEDSGGGGAANQVVLVTHESFALPKQLIQQFEDESGYHLVVRASGDAGTLTNKLVLTKDDPMGDVAFGVDNTFASRALDDGVFAPYDATLPAGAAKYRLPGDDDHALTPVDDGSVCVNVDDTWFADHDLAPPSSFADLADPAYRGLFVVPGAATSSPGMAFLLATIAAFGPDGWQHYWADLMANDTKIVDDWSQAYEVDFTQGGGRGDRPIVVSYDSSPAYTVHGGRTTTSALLRTCFRQVEYAGILAGARNPTGARALVDFLLSRRVQEALPESMYVFPVAAGVRLPHAWARFAKRPAHTWQVSPAAITRHRDVWLREWSDITSR